MDIDEAIKETCRAYRKSCVLGKRTPLTTLRIIWKHAFLAGANYSLGRVGKAMKEKSHDKQT